MGHIIKVGNSSAVEETVHGLDTAAYQKFLLDADYLSPVRFENYRISDLPPFFLKAEQELKTLLGQIPGRSGPIIVSPDEEISIEYLLMGHGRTHMNKGGRVTGWSTEALCHGWKKGGHIVQGGIELALEQAQRINLNDFYLRFVSDLPRALHHALLLVNDKQLRDHVSQILATPIELETTIFEKTLHNKLMDLALQHGFIPTPLLRAQYYGPLEGGPENTRNIEDDGFVQNMRANVAVFDYIPEMIEEEDAKVDALIHRKELLFSYKNDKGIGTETRADLVTRITRFYDTLNHAMLGKRVLAVTSSGCFDASKAYFRYFGQRSKMVIENEPKRRGRELEVKLGSFNGEPCYLNDSKLLDPLRERARNGIRQLRKLSIDHLVRDGKGIVETPLRRVYDENGEEPTEVMEAHGLSGPSISGVLDCEKPVLIFGHGGQGKTILMTEFANWILDNPELSTGDVYVPVMENCGDLNTRSKQTLLNGQNMYDYLRSSAGINSLPTTLLKENKFVFLIDDYQKLNDDFNKELEDAVQRLNKEGHKVILFSRLEKPETLPPKVPGYTLFRIDPSKSLNAFISTRLSDNESGEFREYVNDCGSAGSNYLSLAFLTMLLGKAGNNVLRYIQDEKIAQAIRERQLLNSAQLYEALTDYVVGLDIERTNGNRLSVSDVRTETARLKSLLGGHALNEEHISRAFEPGLSWFINECSLDGIVKFNSLFYKELRGISLLYVKSDVGIVEDIKDRLGQMFQNAYLKGGHLSFIHDTFREFFTARLLLQEIQSGKPKILRTKLSRKTLEFVTEMNPGRDLLYKLIYSTRKMSAKKCGFLGGNCATLLAMLGEDLRAKDFSRTNLCRADLSDQNLEGMVLKSADIKGSVFHYSNLNGVDFRGTQDLLNISPKVNNALGVVGCDGEDGDIYLVNGIGSLVKLNLKDGKEHARMRVGKANSHCQYFLNSKTNRLLVKIFGDLKMYDVGNGKQLFAKKLPVYGRSDTCDFSPDGTLFAICTEPNIHIFDANSGDVVSKTNLDMGCVDRVVISSNNQYVACGFHRRSSMGSSEPDDYCTRLFELRGNKLMELPEFSQLISRGLISEWGRTVFSNDSKLFTAAGGIYSTESLHFSKLHGVSASKIHLAEPQFFTKDDKYLIFKGEQNIVYENSAPKLHPEGLYAHEIATGKEKRLLTDGYSFTGPYILSGDGKLILHGSTDGVSIYSLESEKFPKMKLVKRIDVDSFQRIIK